LYNKIQMTKKTFAEKIAEQERASNEDSDDGTPLYGVPEGVIFDIKVEETKEPVRKNRKPRQKKVVEPVSEEPVVEKVEKPKEKVKRPPSAYNLFVKEAYKRDEVQKVLPKQRFSKVAELWQKEKAKNEKKKK
jgi:hypothetical protein